ncbi:DUF2637 domain-containing protein [Streptomyces sp. NPDC005438]|uniref:DUF2637 domain-containing protein n=1 Tax=Streptomyces sp. NPDC005438 TaxID=3156880 RepID=UPI0033A2102F
MNRTHRILVGVVVAGAVLIAAIGFAGSYSAVRDLAERKGFGQFSPFFPIGVDAGIVVLLALDLLLTWVRIPFPLLRQTAWMLTAATIAFNGAAAWPDPLGVGMHAVIPVLFVVTVEAARHAIGRIADITADKHMEGVRLSRWLLAFPSTFRLWRRMKLWELRSYDQVIRMEQDRLVYEARLRGRYGRAWRRRAPIEAMMPLRLARYGIPLSETASAGLEAAGISPPVRPPTEEARALPGTASPRATERPVRPEPAAQAAPPEVDQPAPAADTEEPPGHPADPEAAPPVAEPAPEPAAPPAVQAPAVEAHPEEPDPARSPHPAPTVPVGPGRVRSLGQASAPTNGYAAYVPPPHPEEEGPAARPAPAQQQLFREPPPPPEPEATPVPEAAESVPEPPAPVEEDPSPVGIPDGVAREEVYFEAFRQFAAGRGDFPNARQLSRTLEESFGITNADGSLLSEPYLREYVREFRNRYRSEMGMAG